eukprot:jgi/Orpsp1_1/1192353/evm.model.d7180000092537.1
MVQSMNNSYNSVNSKTVLPNAIRNNEEFMNNCINTNSDDLKNNINAKDDNNEYKMEDHEVLYGDIFYGNNKYKGLNDVLNDNDFYHYDSSNDIINSYKEYYHDQENDEDSDSLYHSESEDYFSQDEKCESFNNSSSVKLKDSNTMEEDQLNIIHGANDSENYFSQKSDIIFNSNICMDSPLKSETIDLNYQNNSGCPNDILNNKAEMNYDEVSPETITKNMGNTTKKEKIFKFCSSYSSLSSFEDKDSKINKYAFIEENENTEVPQYKMN